MKDRQRTNRRWILVKWERILIVSLLIGTLVGTLIVVNGCMVVPRRRRRRAVVAVETPGGVDVVYVQKAPPKPKAEVRTKSPGGKAVWVPGHWQWNGRKYVWKAGHWNVRPGGKTWVPGHWNKKPRGWRWVPGHWR